MLIFKFPKIWALFHQKGKFEFLLSHVCETSDSPRAAGAGLMKHCKSVTLRCFQAAQIFLHGSIKRLASCKECIFFLPFRLQFLKPLNGPMDNVFKQLVWEIFLNWGFSGLLLDFYIFFLDSIIQLINLQCSNDRKQERRRKNMYCFMTYSLEKARRPV